MAIFKSNAAKLIDAIAYPGCAGEAVVQRYSMAVPTTVANGDILELGCVPAGCRVGDIIFDSDDLDSNGAPAMVIDAGIMSGEFGSDAADRTCGDEFLDGDTLCQAGGVKRPTLVTAYRVAKTDKNRSIGVKIVTKAATAQAGSIGVTVTIVAA